MHQPRKPGDICSANHKLLVCSHYIHCSYVFGVKGGLEGMELKGFDDALMDSSTGLTHAALTGERKQSVGDAERILSFLVAKFLREHGYIREANYIDIVAGWHEAAASKVVGMTVAATAAGMGYCRLPTAESMGSHGGLCSRFCGILAVEADADGLSPG